MAYASTVSGKAATPFGLAPLQQDASKGVLVANTTTTDPGVGSLGDGDVGDSDPQVPAIAPFGVPQVSTAPVAAPTGVSPTMVYCYTTRVLYIWNLSTQAWDYSAAFTA